MKTVGQVILELWYLPSVLPIALQSLTWVFDNFLYKDKDFAAEITLLTATNKVGKATALQKFMEAQFTGGALDNLHDLCASLIIALGRRERLDNRLYGYKKSYRRWSGVLLGTFIFALVSLVAGFAIAKAFPNTRLWLLILAVVVAAISILCVASMRVLSSNLNKVKDHEDLLS